MSKYINIHWRSAPDGSVGWCKICQSVIFHYNDPCARGLHSPEHLQHNCTELGCWGKQAEEIEQEQVIEK